jgi:hypothetical protein
MLNLPKQFNPPKKAVQGTTIQPGFKTTGLNFDIAPTAGIPCPVSCSRIGRKLTTSGEFVVVLESQVAEKQVVGVQRVKTFRPQWHVMLNLPKQFNPPKKAVLGTTTQPGFKTPGLNFDTAPTAGIPCPVSCSRIGRKLTTSGEFVVAIESQVAEK